MMITRVVRRSGCALAAAAVALAFANSPVRAQRLQPPPGAAVQERGLERQFRERFAEIVKRRLNLNDAQMQQLGQVNDRFEQERMRLVREERMARQALRTEVLAGDSADQPKVARLLDQLLGIQRRRLDLTEREQRELSGFMTPRQRAMYFGIQDQLRQRLEELRQQRQQRRAGGVLGTRRPPP
jgi:periplasmic protein CpxP/Spy